MPRDFHLMPKEFAYVYYDYFILDPFVLCGEFHADIVTNPEYTQHKTVILNLESSRTCHSPLTRGRWNQTLLTSLKNLNLLHMQCWLSEIKTLSSIASIRFHIWYWLCEINCKNYPNQNHFRWQRPHAFIKFMFYYIIFKNRLYL